MGNKTKPIALARTFVHTNIIGLVRNYYNKVWGTHIGENTRISLSAKLDRTNPGGVIIGKNTAIAFEATILTHDYVNSRHVDTKIGDCCFVGARAIIMPGVTVGDHCIIGSGAVVMKDVPARSIVLGNPGRVLERGIMTREFGIRTDTPAAKHADATAPVAEQ